MAKKICAERDLVQCSSEVPSCNSDILRIANEKFVTGSESENATFHLNTLCKSSKKCSVKTYSVVEQQQEVTAEPAIVMLQTTTNNLLEQLPETQETNTAIRKTSQCSGIFY